MNIRAHKTRRIFTGLVFGIAVAAIAVPFAHADPVDRGTVPAAIPGGQVTADAGTLDVLIGDAIRAEQASPELDPLIADAIRAEQASPELDPLIADAIRAEQASPELDPLIADAIRAAKAARAHLDGSSPAASQPSVQATQSTSDSFQWRDAGVGAAGMLVFVLLGAGATLVVYRRGRPAAS